MKKFQSKNFLKSASYAVNGLGLAFKSQRNFRNHLIIALTVFSFAIILKLGVLEICVLIFTNTFVLAVELINSVIEYVLDAYYKRRYSRLVKFSKDIAAGAVLLCAVSSMLVTFLLFFNKILTTLHHNI